MMSAMFGPPLEMQMQTPPKDNVTQHPHAAAMDQNRLELENYCNNIADYNATLRDALRRKGFTDDQAFKLLVLSQSDGE